MRNNNQISISGAVVFRDYRKKRQFLIVKQKEDGDWEIPKTTVRKGESSVRAAIRFTGEQAGITAKVLEEAGRASGVATINGKIISQKFYYYLMIQKAAGEPIGFEDYKWIEGSLVLKKLALKREKDIFKESKEVLKTWEKIHKARNY